MKIKAQLTLIRLVYQYYEEIRVTHTQQKILFKTTLRGLPQFRKSIV